MQFTNSDNLFIIGNGKSRLVYNVNSLHCYGKIICCNEAWININADLISLNNKHLTNFPNLTNNILHIPEPETLREIYLGSKIIDKMPNHLIDDNANPREWNSGQVAIIGGIKIYTPNKVFLLGFDFFDIPNPKLNWQKQNSNNVYHNCHNQRPDNIELIYNWITINNRHIEFLRVGPINDPILDKLNMKKMEYNEFDQYIQTCDSFR